jgi:colicin import membrane protein
LPQKKLLFASILLHALFFSLLFMHWDNTEPVKPLYIPSNIQAHVVNPEMLNALKEKQETEQKVVQEKLENEKKVAEQLRKEQQEKERAKQKAKEDALKKAAEEKKRAEQEKLKIKKQKEEKEKLEKERLVKQKKLEEEQKKVAELAKEKERAEKKKEIQEKEQKMLEMLKRMEQQQALAQQQAELKAEQLRQQQAFQALELTEVERFMALIKLRIENLWRIPPKSDNLTITLRIRLLPNGELSSVEVVKSSGNNAFDRSAILAAKSVTRYPVPDDSRIFEKNFRQFSMAFKPESN